MAVNIDLPVIMSFLFLYSLRRGSILVCVWTVLRSLFFLFFFVWKSIDEFLPICPKTRGGTVHKKPLIQGDGFCTIFYYVLYMSYTSMIVIESMLILYSLKLAIGIYNSNLSEITQYLICRPITWCFEIVLLTTITITKDESIEWYMGFLMIVILELYGFIVVYSYLNELYESAMRRKNYCVDGA